MHNFGGNTNPIQVVFKQKQTNHCSRTIPLIYFFPDMSGICQVQQNFPVKANKRSKGTLSRSYGFKVPCLAIQEKYKQIEQAQRPQLEEFIRFHITITALGFQEVFTKVGKSICMYDYQGVEICLPENIVLQAQTDCIITRTQEILKSENSLI